MEYLEQVNAKFYASDFQFCIARQGMNQSALTFPFHWHRFIEILYCDAGTVQVTIENAQYHMTAGDMVLIGPNVVHRTFKEEHQAGSLYNILFDASMVQFASLSEMETRVINSFLNCLFSFNYYYLAKDRVPADMEQLIQRMESRFVGKVDCECLYMRAYLMELIGMICESGLFAVSSEIISNHTMDAVKETVAYIQNHCDEKITLSDMAEKANLSYHYYGKLFKKVTGKPFALYLASARVFMAERLMLEGKYSLQEIADKVGLYPQTNFTHTYKRLRGFSPKEFRKRLIHDNE